MYNFSEALESMKEYGGVSFHRVNWRNPNQYVQYVEQLFGSCPSRMHDYFALDDGNFQLPWTPTNADLLAEDWCPVAMDWDGFDDPDEDPGSFAEALNHLKAGNCIFRKGWYGNFKFLYLVSGSNFKVSRKPLSELLPEGTDVKYHSHIDACLADGSFATWSANMHDIMSNDWLVVEKGKENE